MESKKNEIESISSYDKSSELPNKPGPKKAVNEKISKVESIDRVLQETYVETISDFVQIITSLETRGFTFFRGDKNKCNYSLSPKAYSIEYRSLLEHLDESIEEFAALTMEKNSIVSNGFLEDMINAQHYELPTRLLDWTESALISLYFAVNPEQNNFDSIVWALNPLALNSKIKFLKNYSYIPIFPSKQDKKLVDDLENYYRASKDSNLKYPVSIKTRKVNPRIDAQRGVFVLFCHNDDKMCLTKYEDSESFLHKIIIPFNHARKINKILASLGITQYSILPETKSISVDLINKYNQEGR